ncbi:MAG: DUF58 domain-containing protein [Azoarcus sp.]|jgi:uncharacterized protein (DUF58 family)|nr:DUF58 domain-containing protein [Azoarcus sp.]
MSIETRGPETQPNGESSATAAPARIVLLPTTAGTVWLLAALALLAVAINYGNNLVFALAFLILSVWLMAAWQCRRNLVGLEWLPAPPPMAFAGEALCVAGQVRDMAGRRRDPVALGAGRGRNHRRGVAVGSARRMGDALALELSLPAPERGRRTLGGLHLLALHPLGLWRARRALPALTALVYPHPAGDLPLPGNAPRPAHCRQEAGDFQGVAPYAPGDPLRRVNWRVYARRGEPAVNRYDGGAGGPALWLDASACDGGVEARLSQLCQWVVAAERQGREYGLRPGNGQDRAPGRGMAHYRACLARLALYGETPAQATAGS